MIAHTLKHIVAGAALLLVFTGCATNDRGEAAQKAREAASEAERSAERAAAEAEEKAREAATRADRAAAELRRERDEYIARSQNRLQELDAEIARLETQVKVGAAEANTKAVAELRALRADTAAALEKVRTATGDTFGDMKATLDEAMTKLENAYEHAESIISGK